LKKRPDIKTIFTDPGLKAKKPTTTKIISENLWRFLNVGDIESCKEHLNSINTCNASGLSLLHHACYKDRGSPVNMTTAKALLELGADPNISCSNHTAQNETPLSFYCYPINPWLPQFPLNSSTHALLGSFAFLPFERPVHMVIKTVTDVNKKAVHQDSLELLELLLTYGAKLNFTE
jgi:ankyrin repeat protein